MYRHKIWARRLWNPREHTGDLIEVFSRWAMWHWASRSGENVQRRFGFFHVKRTTFAFTTDSRVNGVWHFRIWCHWFGILLAGPSYLPQETIKRNFYSRKAVTRHDSNQCRWWMIVFSFKAGEDVFAHNNGRLSTEPRHHVACSQDQNRCSDPCRRS